MSCLSIAPGWAMGLPNSPAIVAGISMPALDAIDCSASKSAFGGPPLIACSMTGANLVHSAVE